MTTFKINKNKDFTVMSNYHLRDRNLSLKAKGLLSFMLSLPDDWDYSLKGLVAICKENKDAIRSTLNELKFNYYLQIEPSRGDNGKFEYNYLIYEKPFKIRINSRNSPNTDFPYTDEPSTDNQPQINTNKQSIKEQIDKTDKLDKTRASPNENDLEEVKHNILTKELINLNYISEDDASSFYYDNLFQKYLSEGHNYKELYSAIHYIVPRVMSRNFIDEEGNEITNKYGYFKNSVESNFRRFESYSKDLYSEDDYKDFWDDFEGR